MIPSVEEVVRGFVRGVTPLERLKCVGIDVRVDPFGERVEVDNIRGVAVRISAPEIADGLLRQLYRPDVLRLWATVILGAPSLIELDMDRFEGGSALLEALWDVSFGDEVESGAIEVAKKIVSIGS